MDPGNWATSLESGSRFGYKLLWIVTLSSAIAILMQILSAKLGIVTGRDLAQMMRERYSPPVRRFLFVTAFVAMMATDLAEFMGVAIALNLLFGIPLTIAVLLTVFDVLFILWLERFGFRWVEMVILAFVATIGLAYVVEIVLARPDLAEVARNAFLPNTTIFESTAALFLAMGILGATVMPHNLYLHSAQVKTRVRNNPDARERIIKMAALDTVSALGAAWLVNGAILVMAASVFHQNGILVTEIDQAYLTLAPLLGKAAALTFAIALLASGISSSTTGTLAGQIVFEGFLRIRVRRIALLRLGVRLLTMAPAGARQRPDHEAAGVDERLGHRDLERPAAPLRRVGRVSGRLTPATFWAMLSPRGDALGWARLVEAGGGRARWIESAEVKPCRRSWSPSPARWSSPRAWRA